MNTDTPETDGLEYPAEVLAIAAEKIKVVHSDFARRLERQRDDALRSAEKLRAYRKVMKNENARLRRELEKAIHSLMNNPTTNPTIHEQ